MVAQILQIGGAITLLSWMVLGGFAVAMYVTTKNAERRAMQMVEQLLRETSRFLETCANSA